MTEKTELQKLQKRAEALDKILGFINEQMRELKADIEEALEACNELVQ